MILTLVIAFLSLIILMIVHEFGHFIIAKKFGVKVEEFGIGYPPKIFGKKFGETVYSINLIPLGAFVKIYGEEGLPAQAGGIDDYRSFSHLAIWKRILIVLGGVLAFWIASIIIFSVVFGIGATIPVGDQDVVGIHNTRIEITKVQSDSPAQIAGLKVGDQLLKVSESAGAGSGTLTIDKISDFQQFVKAHSSEQLDLLLERGGQQMNVLISPRVNPPEGQGPTGVQLERIAEVIKKYPWYQAPWHGLLFTGEVTWQAIQGLYNVVASLFAGKGVPAGAELAGPIGITIFLAKAADYGVGFFLYFIGSLSVLIALFNIFPIPALDGGKLVFLIIEKIKGKPVSANVEQVITIVFFLLLISMSIFITIKFDFPRVVDFWKAGI